MLGMHIDLPIEIRTESRWHAAEAEILVMGRTVGYVGGSAYEDTVREAAEDAIFAALAPLIQAHPDVVERSRYDYEEIQ